MRITAYGDRLVDDLDLLDWPEKVKAMQRNWIGRSEGAQVRFALGDQTGQASSAVEVFTTRPDTLFGATFMVLAPENAVIDDLVPDTWPEGTKAAWTGGGATPAEALAAYRKAAAAKTDLERRAEGRGKTGVFTGVYATNPASGARLPVVVADYELSGYDTGAIVAGQDEDDHDYAFATSYGLLVGSNVQPP